MKTLERINVYNTDKIIIGYLDDETEIPDIENLDLKISELTQEEQDLTNDCLDILRNQLSETETLSRSLMQITKEQHECEERVLIWFNIENEEEQGNKIFPKRLMTIEDKVKYEDFKSMCQDLLENN